MIAGTLRMLMLVWAAELVSILLATPALCAEYTAYSLKVPQTKPEQPVELSKSQFLDAAGMNSFPAVGFPATHCCER